MNDRDSLDCPGVNWMTNLAAGHYKARKYGSYDTVATARQMRRAGGKKKRKAARKAAKRRGGKR